MMARLVKVNGHPPSLQSTLQRCKGLLLLTLWGSRVAVRLIYYRREVTDKSMRKPEDVHLRVVNSSYPLGRGYPLSGGRRLRVGWSLQ